MIYDSSECLHTRAIHPNIDTQNTIGERDYDLSHKPSLGMEYIEYLIHNNLLQENSVQPTTVCLAFMHEEKKNRFVIYMYTAITLVLFKCLL